uniref:Uncharacterized protein n=1 Tax=Glossina austeni TaxID=7395 RepID=A0A1A9VFI1_GLOAU
MKFAEGSDKLLALKAKHGCDLLDQQSSLVRMDGRLEGDENLMNSIACDFHTVFLFHSLLFLEKNLPVSSSPSTQPDIMRPVTVDLPRSPPAAALLWPTLMAGLAGAGFLSAPSGFFSSAFLSSGCLSPAFVSSEAVFAASAAAFGAVSGFSPLGAAGAAPLEAVAVDLASGLAASVFFSSLFLSAASGLVAASGLATLGLAAAFVGGAGAEGLLSAGLASDVFGGTGGAFVVSVFLSAALGGSLGASLESSLLPAGAALGSTSFLA